jgi:formate dehydrogenase assembly factor FdhD
MAFSLTEGLVSRKVEIEAIDIVPAASGIVLRISIAVHRAALFWERRRRPSERVMNALALKRQAVRDQPVRGHDRAEETRVKPVSCVTKDARRHVACRQQGMIKCDSIR